MLAPSTFWRFFKEPCLYATGTFVLFITAYSYLYSSVDYFFLVSFFAEGYVVIWRCVLSKDEKSILMNDNISTINATNLFPKSSHSYFPFRKKRL
jgi:hypothetical protein